MYSQIGVFTAWGLVVIINIAPFIYQGGIIMVEKGDN